MPLRPLILGEGWADSRSGGLNRFYAGLTGYFRESLDLDFDGVLVGPVSGAPENIRIVSDAGRPLFSRLWAFKRAAESCTEATVVDVHFALYGWLPVVAGKLRSKPLVVHFQGPWAEESLVNRSEARWRIRVKHLIEASLYRRAERVLVLSTAFKGILVEDYGVMPWSISVVPPGIDLDYFSVGDKEGVREELALDSAGKVVVTMRRLVPRMGVDVLLESWSRLESEQANRTLLILGDGPYRSRLETMAAELEIAGSVRFLGRVEDSVLLQCYRAADLTVVPTIELEGFGLVVLESLACGTPVIATNCGGLPEALAPLDAGLLVPPGDSAALSAKLDSVLSGRAPAPSPAECRRYAENFSWQRAASRTLEVYEEAMTGSVPKPRVVFLDHCAELSGGELALLRLLPSLSEIDTHVILAEDGPFADRLAQEGISAEVLPMAERARGLSREKVSSNLRSVRTLLETMAYVLRVAYRLRKLKADIVHTNSLKSALYGSLAARLAGVPSVVHLRDRLAADYLPGSAVRLAKGFISRLPSAVICNSGATRDYLGSEVAATVIPSPVALNDFHAVSRGVREPKANLRFGIVGRIAEWKGQHLFLEAFSQAFPSGDAQASIVGAALFGEEEYEASLRKLVSTLELDGRVEFRGFQEDVGGELAKLDVLVHASIIPEPFGQVVIEGMAAGLPVLAANAGGPAEIITDGVDGLLYQIGDVEALAGGLRRLADDSTLRAKLGTAGIDRARDFSPVAIAPQVMEVYRSVRPNVFGDENS